MMNPLIWHKVAAISGMAALGLGTYGAHVWQTASLYHLTHTAALLAAPLTKYPTIFGGLLTTGILAFSGTISQGINILSQVPMLFIS
ncbi:Transmembrane protein 256-like protein [Drosera capensis]